MTTVIPALGSLRLIQALRERQLTRTCCAHCEWEITGPLADTREMFREHLIESHPEVQPSMPNPRELAIRGGMQRVRAAA